MTKLTEDQQEQALNTFLETCPFVGLWGKTGQGKTTFISQLMEHQRYRKMLFIDIDRGFATIAHLTGQEDLCIHRDPKNCRSFLEKYAWAARELDKADQVEGVGSIVIEGLAGIYNGIATELQAEMDPLDIVKKNRLRRTYIPAASACKILCVKAANLRARLTRAGRAVPVVVTMTTKKKKNEEDEEWYVPGVSDNAADFLQESLDAFVQVTRPRKNSGIKLLTDINDRCDQLKLRHAGAAAAVAGLKNPGLADMFQAWANATAVHSNAVAEHLSQEQETQDKGNNT